MPRSCCPSRPSRSRRPAPCRGPGLPCGAGRSRCSYGASSAPRGSRDPTAGRRSRGSCRPGDSRRPDGSAGSREPCGLGRGCDRCRAPGPYGCRSLGRVGGPDRRRGSANSGGGGTGPNGPLDATVGVYLRVSGRRWPVSRASSNPPESRTASNPPGSRGARNPPESRRRSIPPEFRTAPKPPESRAAPNPPESAPPEPARVRQPNRRVASEPARVAGDAETARVTHRVRAVRVWVLTAPA